MTQKSLAEIFANSIGEEVDEVLETEDGFFFQGEYEKVSFSLDGWKVQTHSNYGTGASYEEACDMAYTTAFPEDFGDFANDYF